MSVPDSGLSDLLREAQAPHRPRDAGPTRRFGPRPPVPAAASSHRTPKPLLFAPLVLLVGLGALFARHPAAAGPRRCGDPMPPVPVGAQVVQGDVAGIGCVMTGVYAHDVLTIRLLPSDPSARRFALGRPGDILQLGDWDCDGASTPALYRPSTGAVLYYDTWSALALPSNKPRCRSFM